MRPILALFYPVAYSIFVEETDLPATEPPRALPYLAAPHQAIVSRDLGLVVGDLGASVVRRGRSGIWRFAIVAPSPGGDNERESS